MTENNVLQKKSRFSGPSEMAGPARFGYNILEINLSAC
jgi:hypothetical protein